MGWKVSALPADFDRLRENDAFAELLTLGRVANLLRAALYSATQHGHVDDSSAQRARMSMTLLLTGLIAEALPALERSGKHFRHLPAFKQSILPILKDAKVESLRSRWFAPLRNQAVFHNDAVVSRKGLALMKPAIPQEIACGSSTSFMDAYYPTADVIAILYIVEAAGAVANPVAFLSDAIGTVVDVTTRICLALDTLIGQSLNEFGFTLEETPPPAA